MTKLGESRFLKTVAGRTYFAAVAVAVEESSGEIQVVENLLGVDPLRGEVDRSTHPAWVDAAIHGAREMATRLRSSGAPGSGWRIEIRKLAGTTADTREDVVACTAGIATWRAICGDGANRPSAVLEDGSWKLSLG